MKEDIKDILSSITDEQITEILMELGSHAPIVNPSRPNERIFSSICHGDIQKMKLYCYTNEYSHSFNCFACSEHFSNIINLVMHVSKVEFSEAISYVKRKCGISSFTSKIKRGFGDSQVVDDWSLFAKYKTKRKTEPKQITFNKSVMDLFSPLYYEGWIEEHISVEAMKSFDIKYYHTDNAIVLPHYDIDGNLVGIRKRNLNERDVALGFKYMPISVERRLYNHQLGFYLYGLHKNKENIKGLKKCILFESEKSILQCQSYYGESSFAVACCGSNMSTVQRDILLSLGVEELIIAFDRDYTDEEDKKYEIFKKKIFSVAKKCSPYMSVYVIHKGMKELIGVGDSPSDCGKEVLEKLMKQKEYLRIMED